MFCFKVSRKILHPETFISLSSGSIIQNEICAMSHYYYLIGLNRIYSVIGIGFWSKNMLNFYPNSLMIYGLDSDIETICLKLQIYIYNDRRNSFLIPCKEIITMKTLKIQSAINYEVCQFFVVIQQNVTIDFNFETKLIYRKLKAYFIYKTEEKNNIFECKKTCFDEETTCETVMYSLQDKLCSYSNFSIFNPILSSVTTSASYKFFYVFKIKKLVTNC